jgi:hypothetical protein
MFNLNRKKEVNMLEVFVEAFEIAKALMIMILGLLALFAITTLVIVIVKEIYDEIKGGWKS